MIEPGCGAVAGGRALEGSVALVTGASSGIGAGVARGLAARGAAVALVARRADRLAALEKELLAAGGRALAVPADIGDAGPAEAAVRRAVEEFGRLDILVNNAGLTRRGAAMDVRPADLEAMVRVNLLGAMFCAHAALPHLVRAAAEGPRQVADVVNVSSLSGRIVRRDAGVYSATKHGMNAWSEALRQELADRRVRVSLLEPAAVQTELFADQDQDPDPGPDRARPAAGRAFRRLSPADVAEAVDFMVTRPRHAAVSELLIRPAGQE
jgi:NADP-dependent 3-hydroxy acid dehydrogenase YdfG